MPPLCNEKPCPPYSGRRNRVLRALTQPTLLTGETLHGDNDDDDANDSDENVSPDAEKSEIRFTLERKQATTNNSGNNGRNDNSRNGDGGGNSGRSSGDFQSNRNGSHGDRRDGNFRFQNNNSGSNNDNDNNSNNNNDGNGNNRDGSSRDFFDNDREGNDRGGGGLGFFGGGGGGGGGGGDRNNNNNGDDDNDDSRNRGSGRFGEGNGRGNDNGNNNRDGNRGGDGNDGSGGNRDGSDSNNNASSSSSPLPPSSSSPPPPPSSETATSTTSTDGTSTTTSVETLTSVTESQLPTPAPATSTTEGLAIPLITPQPASIEPSPVAQPIPITSAASVATSLEYAVDSGILTSTSALSSAIPDSEGPVPTQTSTTGGQGGRQNDNNRHRGPNGKFNGFRGNNRIKGLDPTAERILVATGSLGILIVLCFICWIVFKTLRKSKRSNHRATKKNWLSKWIPCGRRSARSKMQANVAHEPKVLEEPPLAYDARDFNSMQAPDYYSQEKLYSVASEGETYPSTEKPPNGIAMWQTAEPQPPLSDPLGPRLQPNGQVMEAGDINSTLQSQMASAYYNQSGLSRQPSDAYNPARGQGYRASEISSLSSGFGDGDIIVTQPNTVVIKPPIAAQRLDTETGNRQGSWISRSGSVVKRDSVYTTTTTTSERPTRFRSIHSWVDQQKTRLKRADSRAKARGEVPVMPALPGQINVTQQTAYR